DIDRELLLTLETGPQGLAFDERHDVEEQPARVATVEQRKDMRMLKLGRRLDLGEEAIAAECGSKVRMENFDCEVAVVLEVVREVYGRHTTGADLPVDAIAIGKRSLELQQRRHCRRLSASG